ncbi:DNA-methyltransferase [Mycolicibacterium fortuitum]|uniref:DNA-methyltransferase n=1 Tax=Mycolicibacterium fortuitum TaxID=1766 RepID=UPI00263880FB|nr:site-specific DNA-methyltransferase [Mycolicibacterium fortuitum]
MMQPYYQDDSVTLYHGDCLEILPSIDGVDLVVTSPPYNLGATPGGAFGHYRDGQGRGGQGKWDGAGADGIGYSDHSDAMPPAEYEEWQKRCLVAMWWSLSDRGAIFYNHKPRVQADSVWLPLALNPGLPVRQIIVWARAGGVNFAPTHYMPTHEWILVFAKDAWRLKSKGASGVGDVWRINQEPNALHPAPFPIGLPAQAIETTAPRLVLDPFAGSGTTLRAAANAGVPSIGIEKSERYCELIAKRLDQMVLDFGSVS